MKKSTAVYVGMDVHKDSIDIALAEAGVRGEVRHYGTIGGGLGDVDRALRKIVAGGREPHVVYEAGPCGYALYRHLSAKGIECAVVSPSRIPKRAGDRVKTDRRDAEMLARLHRAGELEAVHVSRSEDEAMRDLTISRAHGKATALAAASSIALVKRAPRPGCASL